MKRKNRPGRPGVGRKPNAQKTTLDKNPFNNLSPHGGIRGRTTAFDLSSTDPSAVDTRPVDEHPFRTGHCLVVEYRDGSHRLAKIIEKLSSSPTSLLSENKSSNSSSGSRINNNVQTSNSERSVVSEEPTATTMNWRYYVHYFDFNRRMDEWISFERIISLPSIANPLGELRKKQDDHTHHLKRHSSSDEIGVTNGATISDIKEVESDEGDEEESDHSDSDTDDANEDYGNSSFLVDREVDGGVTTVAEMEHDEHEGLDEQSLLEHEEITKIKNINYVLFGKHTMECCYYSPFPKEFFPNGPIECLYFCEFTFNFFKTKNELVRYQTIYNLPRHPPGNEIYRDDEVSMFELDGAVEKVYCQNLCYFAKLFLDHKTLYWDVDPFLFYVLCTQDDRGYHPVGFFSKEKYSDMGYNLACILTFPSAQRKGYGRFLIAFSYELSKKEEKVGSPEKPLSDLGAVSYKSYWASTLLTVLKSYPGQQLSITDLTRMTSILTEDVIATLNMLGLLVNVDAFFFIYAPPSLISDLMIKFPSNGLNVDPDQLHWKPLYVTDVKKDKWSLNFNQ